MSMMAFQAEVDTGMSKVEAYLLTKDTKTYSAYYNGKMSYELHGEAWANYVAQAFPDLGSSQTSENIFKDVIDLYAENLVPTPEPLRGFSNSVVPLLSRGECVVIVDQAGEAHFPEHFEVMSDGRFTIAAVFNRNLELMEDTVTFINTSGVTRIFSKSVPDDFSKATQEGYTFKAQETGSTLFRFALDDKGFGASMAALQDRVNHSIIDQTVIAEMYARPFWYLLNVDIAPQNPYLPPQPGQDAIKEHKDISAAARIFTTNGEGPFGQLTPPTISDMIAYHDSITDKVSSSSGVPQYYFKPGSGTPPTGVALKVLSKRFNNKIARMREDITPEMERLADLLGVEKTKEVRDPNEVKAKRGLLRRAVDKLTGNEPEDNPEMEYELWNTSDDLLQESLDAHGLSLSQMGYPLEYIASVVTPGVDLSDYESEEEGGLPGSGPNGEPVDMTAMGQRGLTATPGQVQAYGANPGQVARS